MLRKIGALPDHAAAQTLRRMWPLLPEITIVEYKSPGRPYRAGDLDRLWSCAHAYHADPSKRPAQRPDLCAVLAVPGRTPSLDGDVATMGHTWWQDLGGGYWRVVGGLFTLYVVELGEVAGTEGDVVLGSLGDGRLDALEARQFWAEIVGSQEAGMSMQDLEGYDELMGKLLASMPPEQVLAHYPPEQRLAGIDRDHEALALSVDLLRVLPESYIRSLPADVQEEIGRRLRRGALAGIPLERVLAGLTPEQRVAGIPPEQRLAGLDRDHVALALSVDVLRALPESYIRSLSPGVQEEIGRRLLRGSR